MCRSGLDVGESLPLALQQKEEVLTGESHGKKRQEAADSLAAAIYIHLKAFMSSSIRSLLH